MENKKIEALLSEARLLPNTPGVYKMLDKTGKVIYVGKSKALKNRVSGYFQNLQAHTPKTLRMVERVERFDCLFTDTETEALVLENELIKLFSPKFNIRLKDDKSYPYIKLSISEKYPRLTMVRTLSEKRNSADKYFGPYSSSSAVKKIIDTVNKLFLLPTCKLSFPRDFGKNRPCLNYHIGKCMGMCKGEMSEVEYRNIIKNVITFLKSDYEGVIRELEKEMLALADGLKFEEAVIKRDLISSIKNLRSHQKIIFEDKVERDVFGTFVDDMSSCIAISVVREGRIIDSERFVFTKDEILDAHTLSQFVAEYYKSRGTAPREVLFEKDCFSDELEFVREYLSLEFSKKIKFIYPEKGDLKKAVTMASANAKEYAIHKRTVADRSEEKLFTLATLLSLEVLPERIEAYDISNSASSHITAGMITVKDGRFSKKDYKLFNIRSATQDDYASMREALDRRITNYFEEKSEKGKSENWALPDLILLDGGKNHVRAVKEVLDKYSLDIALFGMVKDEHHKTRTLVDCEGEISIAKNPTVFNFIYSIQEEVHRFTFKSMDKKRTKSVTRLSLEKIDGIGEKKAKALLSHFKSIKGIREASVKELSLVKGISLKNAQNIHSYFNQNNENEDSLSDKIT